MNDQYSYYEEKQESESENNVKCDLEICICSKASSIAFALAENIVASSGSLAENTCLLICDVVNFVFTPTQ